MLRRNATVKPFLVSLVEPVAYLKSELAAEKETAAGYYAISASREALFGDAAEARQQASVAKRGSTGRDLDYGVALALAYAGDATRAQTLADDLDKSSPEDTRSEEHTSELQSHSDLVCR